jgi:NADH-dependent peroxiredoxin subunit C
MGQRRRYMSDVIRLGHPVPNFELNAYFPDKKDFGKINLEQLKRDKKWTILFFYPADFTFV